MRITRPYSVHDTKLPLTPAHFIVLQRGVCTEGKQVPNFERKQVIRFSTLKYFFPTPTICFPPRWQMW